MKVRAATLFALFITTVYANTEKAIFLAPSISNWETFSLTRQDYLTPSAPKLRKSLPVAFPTADQPYGTESWFLLGELTPDQRHEVRVCWAATQPTNFRLDVFDSHEVLSANRKLYEAATKVADHWPSLANQKSAVLLRIQAAADFFTTDKTRMQSPPSVDVDIILDPYLGSIFPKSLLPTAGYIICLAIGSYFLSGAIWSRLQSISKDSDKQHTE